MQGTQDKPTTQASGSWVTEIAFAEHFNISRQTLSNWRWQDSLIGRDGAAPGKPQYRRFGRAIRYWLPKDA